MTRTAVAIAGLLATMGGTARAEDLLARIKSGEIIVHSLAGGAVKPGRAMGLVNAPADVVAEVIGSIAEYKAFVPRCTGSRRVKANAFVVELELPWPVNRTWAYVQLERRQSKAGQFLRWRMLNGTLKSYEGLAWIQPLDKDRTVLTYQMLAVPHTAAPDGLITRGLRNAVKSMMEAVRKRSAVVLARRPAKGVNVAAQ